MWMALLGKHFSVTLPRTHPWVVLYRYQPIAALGWWGWTLNLLVLWCESLEVWLMRLPASWTSFPLLPGWQEHSFPRWSWTAWTWRISWSTKDGWVHHALRTSSSSTISSLCFKLCLVLLLKSKRETMMFYPVDPTEHYGLFAIRLRKYKAHFYTRGTAGFFPEVLDLSVCSWLWSLGFSRFHPQLLYAGQRVLIPLTPQGARPSAPLRPGRGPPRALPPLAGG